MTWSSHLDWDANCVLAVHHDFPDEKDFFEFRRLVMAHPRYRRGINLLSDLRPALLPDNVGFDWVFQNASMLKDFYSELGVKKDAIVFKSPAGFGFGNQVRQFLDDTSCDRRPFNDMREAKRWLGLCEDYRLDLVPNDYPESSGTV